MPLRLPPALAAAAACSLAALLASDTARACGGCFHPPDPPASEVTVVSAHRMALSISKTQTVLWDQVRYSGTPSEFAWVLPVKPGAYVELGSDAWFDTLDAATSVRVTPPPLDCSNAARAANPYYGGSDEGCDCNFPFGGMSASDEVSPPTEYAMPTGAGGEGGGGAEPPPVTVVHQGSVGPYDTVTVSTTVPDALPTWLAEHGFAIDADIAPIIEAYASEGFDFIALRLAPDQGVQQMKPVRVVSPGASPTLPLRMVAAGTGPRVSITLFVIGEGRWETDNFPVATIDPGSISWDFNTEKSTYASTRSDLLTAGDGRTWLASYARKGAIFSPVLDPTTGLDLGYELTNGTVASPLWRAYVTQATINGEASSASCSGALAMIGNSGDEVVDLCPDDGSACAPLGPGQIDAATLACGDLDDLAVALTGLRPRDVWVGRLEASLPRAALAKDLALRASSTQAPIENLLVAPKATNEPCPLAASAAGASPPEPPRNGRRDLSRLALALALAGVTLARRAARRPFATVAPSSA